MAPDAKPIPAYHGRSTLEMSSLAACWGGALIEAARGPLRFDMGGEGKKCERHTSHYRSGAGRCLQRWLCEAPLRGRGLQIVVLFFQPPVLQAPRWWGRENAVPALLRKAVLPSENWRLGGGEGRAGRGGGVSCVGLRSEKWRAWAGLRRSVTHPAEQRGGWGRGLVWAWIGGWRAGGKS